ncbi:hypothetical protein [Aeromicrobium endophyticum]|uniref:Uncharacterized protein n=1 Tax=Aeromicrobium endophyticum TaxID=2292704 RepID=A0A371PCI3_9ACTN|nr:hypothetical protein [Aeromicrobium endophyticum]REK73661.1 hypothetical protein DX116_09050 [Aeromicrobium endophyticum]
MTAAGLDLAAVKAKEQAVVEARERVNLLHGSARRAGKTFARETLFGAAVESALDVPALVAEVERLRKALATIKATYHLQCPPQRSAFADGKFGEGAYTAHRWWSVCLGGDLERAGATS